MERRLRSLAKSRDLLVRVLKLLVLLAPELALALLGDVLDHGLDAVLGLELADKAGVPGEEVSQSSDRAQQRYAARALHLVNPSSFSHSPEFRSNSEVLAATHERVRLARLGGSRHARGVKVLLLSTGNGDQTGSVSLPARKGTPTSSASKKKLTRLRLTDQDTRDPIRATRCGDQCGSRHEEPCPSRRGRRQR